MRIVSPPWSTGNRYPLKKSGYVNCSRRRPASTIETRTAFLFVTVRSNGVIPETGGGLKLCVEIRPSMRLRLAASSAGEL